MADNQRPQITAERIALSIPVALMPGEGLPDLLLRATALNGFSRPFEIMELIGGSKEQRFSHFGAAKWNLGFEGFAQLSGAFKDDAAFEHLLYQKSTREGVSFFGRNLPLHQLIGHRRIAPGAVRLLGYQKAVWHINSLTFDPQSFEMLIDRCPKCSSELSFRQTLGIGFCHSCRDVMNRSRSRTDLTEFLQPAAEIDDHEAAAFVTSLIDPEVNIHDLHLDRLHPELRGCDPGHLFDFVAQVGKAMDYKDGRCQQLKMKFSAVGEVTPNNLCRAARAFMNWPDGFVETAASLADSWFFPRAKNYYDHPLRIRISAKLYGHSFRKSVVARLKQSKKLSLVKKSAIKGRNSAIGIVGSADGKVRPAAVEKFLLSYAKSSKAIRAESAATGIPVSSLILCYEEGGFRCPDELFMTNDALVLDLASAVTDAAHKATTLPKKILSLRDVVSALGGAEGNPWPSVLSHIAKGMLPVVKKGRKGALLDNLYVRDFRPWKAYAVSAGNFHSMNGFFLTGHDAAFLLNSSIAQISHLVKANLLPQGKIPANKVWEFRRKFITPREVASRLVINGESAKANLVGVEMNRFSLKMVTAEVFVRHRAEVEEFYGRRLVISREESQNFLPL